MAESVEAKASYETLKHAQTLEKLEVQRKMQAEEHEQKVERLNIRLKIAECLVQNKTGTEFIEEMIK